MRILVSGNTVSVKKMALVYPNHIGQLLTPANWARASVFESGLFFGVDNGAYSGFDPDAFAQLLDRVRYHPERCLWVCCPDVVASAKETIKKFYEWKEKIEKANLPCAFVGQDGIENLTVPWKDFSCWFIGGSTRWKLSQASVDMALEAKRLGKTVHCGRVNSEKRLRWAKRIGCDSVDGKSYSSYGDLYLRKHLCFLELLDRNDRLQKTFF